MARRVFAGVLCLAILADGFDHGAGQAAPLAAAAPDLTEAEREQSFKDQAQLWQQAVQLRREGKVPECREAVGKALALEKQLCGDTTHVYLFLTEYAAGADEAAKDTESALKKRLAATAVQLGFLGDRPAEPSPERMRRLEQALTIRSDALGPGHRWVGLTLVDLALAQEAADKADLAEASLKRALDVFRPIAVEPGFAPTGFLTDASYHLDRIRRSAGDAADADGPHGRLPEHFAHFLADAEKRCAEAEKREQAGETEQARTLLRANLLFQGFGGEDFSCSEEAQLEMARRSHAFLSRYLSFEGRAGAAGKAAAAYSGSIANFKGAIYTQLRSVRLERYHPSLKPFFDAYDEATRKLAALVPQGAGPDTSDDARRREARALRARRAALEAELGRRRQKLPLFMNAPVDVLLPPGAVLVDYLAYDYFPLPGEKKETEGVGRRLACFVSRKGAPTAYLDLGPLEPVAEAVTDWRRAIRKHGGGFERGFQPDDPGGASGSGAPQIVLRKRVWEPVQSYLDKAEVVLISPDGPLASAPFGALPGSKPNGYLLEEYPLVLAPTPRLIVPLKSQTEFLARRDSPSWSLWETRPDPVDAPLLLGGVDFDAPAAGAPAGEKRERRFPPLPGTAKEVAVIGDFFKNQFPDRRPHVLSGRDAVKAAVCAELPRCRWLHLATHGYFAPAPAAGGSEAPELRSALALCGANTIAPAGTDNGILTALEVASMDLDSVDLAVLSACETGLGEVQEGEGVLGLQRAFLVAGVKTSVASLWSIDDAATQALMAEFYKNLWERKLTPRESLRQAQLSMLGGDLYRPPGIEAGTRLPPAFWAAFLLAGEWKR